MVRSAAGYAVTTANVTLALSGADIIQTPNGFPMLYNTQANTFSYDFHMRVTQANTDVTITPTFSTSPPSGLGINFELVQIPQNSTT